MIKENVCNAFFFFLLTLRSNTLIYNNVESRYISHSVMKAELTHVGTARTIYHSFSMQGT